MSELQQLASSFLERVTSLEDIARLEALALAESGRERGDFDDVVPVTHHFAPGLYAREMLIPAGTYVVGKTHRHDHLCTVVKGRIMVASEHGNREVKAGETFLSKAGVKRAGVALEDTIWITFHPTDKVDLAEIEADVIQMDAITYTPTEALS